MADDGAGVSRTRTIKIVIVTFVLVALAVFGLTALFTNFLARQPPADTSEPIAELTDETDNPLIWAKYFPLEYDGYQRRPAPLDYIRFARPAATPVSLTADLQLPAASASLDKTFRESRGHSYLMGETTLAGGATGPERPSRCLNCHASAYVAYNKLGQGDLSKGFVELNKMKFDEARKLVTQPISCIDCHDPQTRRLRITRPAFMEGIRAWKASQGIPGYDVNKMATRQEMRSFVCGQCHAEYYFKEPEKRPAHPWNKGLQVDNILAYYDETGHQDWVAGDAKLVFAQHPQFEMWNQGVHARSGVACADCHMPYTREGGQKISDHHARSPLLSINRSCQVCHHIPEAEIRGRVDAIQSRTQRLRDLANIALTDLSNSLSTARSAGKSAAVLAPAYDFQRRAVFYLSFVQAEHSQGFHAPQESARILSEAINNARQGQLAIPR